jgi:hypothetical protein
LWRSTTIGRYASLKLGEGKFSIAAGIPLCHDVIKVEVLEVGLFCEVLSEFFDGDIAIVIFVHFAEQLHGIIIAVVREDFLLNIKTLEVSHFTLDELLQLADVAISNDSVIFSLFLSLFMLLSCN